MEKQNEEAGPHPQKFLSYCHFVEFVCRKRIFIFIYTFRISHVQNTKIQKCPQSIANISQINLIFTISEGRRLEQRKAILRSYFSFYFILMFRKRNCIHSLSNALFTPLALPLSIIRIMYPLVFKQRVMRVICPSTLSPVNNSWLGLAADLARAPALYKYDRI